MIGLDTNVLVRLVVEDDDKQFANAVDIMHKYADSGEKVYIDDVVICELVWVLSRAYKYTRGQIVSILGALLSMDQWQFRNLDVLKNTFELYKVGQAGFVDYFISARSKESGCDMVYSFDRAPIEDGVFVDCRSIYQ